jgi:hypothetical protein
VGWPLYGIYRLIRPASARRAPVKASR